MEKGICSGQVCPHHPHAAASAALCCLDHHRAVGITQQGGIFLQILAAGNGVEGGGGQPAGCHGFIKLAFVVGNQKGLTVGDGDPNAQLAEFRNPFQDDGQLCGNMGEKYIHPFPPADVQQLLHIAGSGTRAHLIVAVQQLPHHGVSCHVHADDFYLTFAVFL